MKLSPHLTEGVFITRLNRFAALVEIDGRTTHVHVANSGRLRELLRPGVRVLLTPVSPGTNRKTAYDLSLVDLGHTLVSADARLPNALVYEALEQSLLPQFATYGAVVRERVFGDSRLDLLLSDGPKRCYVEVKSVTLTEERTALFPDAPTTRGQRHVRALARAIQEGFRASVIFVIQREDVDAFRPNDTADHAFGQALREAHNSGVEVYAYRCRVTPEQIALSDQVPVLLPALPVKDTVAAVKTSHSPGRARHD